jgi:hypothetical protein
MDLISKFLNKISHKFPKGYPDMNDEQDISLLENLVNEILGKDIKLSEANLAGPATGYPGALGAFTKYVLGNSKNKDLDFESDRDASLYDKKLNKISDISKGTKFKVLATTENDLILAKNSYYSPIKLSGKQYYIRISDIRKPTGKSVESLPTDVSSKSKGVFAGFVPGHPQEGKVVELFITDSDDNWNFAYGNQKGQIMYLGEPKWKGKGKPKTDVQISLNKSLRKDIGSDLKISLKAGNAEFVENWIIPPRALQILGQNVLKQEILKILKLYNSPAKKSTSKNLALFISTNPNSYPSAYKLDPNQKYEAYLGAKKFGEDSPAVANCFFKGDVPDTIEKFIKSLIPLNTNTIDNLEDLYIYVRGSNESRGSSFFASRATPDSPWKITPEWAEILK